MNLKTLIALIAAALVIGGLTLKMMKKDSAEWQTVQTDGFLFEGLPINDVDQINITKGSDTLTLGRENELWVVKNRLNYPADFQQISGLVRTLSELKPLRTVEAGPSQFGRLNLLSPSDEETSGTLLELQGTNGSSIASMLLGKIYIRQSETMRSTMPGMNGEVPEGRYILVGTNAPVYLVGETFENITANPISWLNKDFIKVERLSSVSVQFTGESSPDWTFTRENENTPFQLVDRAENENVDDSKTRILSGAFSYAAFNDVLSPDTDPTVTRLNAPTIAVLKTFDGFTYTLNIGKLTPDETGRYLSIQVQAQLPTERIPEANEKEEDKERLDAAFQVNLTRLQEKLEREKQYEKWIYIVSNWNVENLLKNRINWMKDSTAEKESAPNESIPLMLEPTQTDETPLDESLTEETGEPADSAENEEPVYIEETDEEIINNGEDEVLILEDELQAPQDIQDGDDIIDHDQEDPL